MKTLLFVFMCASALAYLFFNAKRPSRRHRSIDVILPAYNEEVCLEASISTLLANPYVNKVICVNDGSNDRTSEILEWCARKWTRLIAVNQENTGKGGALMHGLQYATAEQVFLTDADTFVPPDGDDLGYLLAEIEDGADAVGGIPSSNLSNAGLLPYIRATVKLPMIAIKRTFQQLTGGAPFIISGACGMFRTEVLRKTGFSDRTKVEDLDLTWTLVAQGYDVRHCNRCVVFPQECNSIVDEWKRWRRWIVGFAVCMRLHAPLLKTRFGLFSILPMFAVIVVGIAAYLWALSYAVPTHGLASPVKVFFPLAWVVVVIMIASISAVHHRNILLLALAPLAVVYVILSYAIWAVHGLKGLLTGREPARDKPTRYAYVVA